MIARPSRTTKAALLTLLSLAVPAADAAMKVRAPGAEGEAPAPAPAPAPAAAPTPAPGSKAAPAGAAPAPAAAPAPKPALAKPKQAEADYFVGSVLFSRGSQIVAEVKGGAKERERFVIYDQNLRRRGQALALKSLEEGVYLLSPVGSPRVGTGDRLARESEAQAIYRVLKENRPSSYREFLETFPESSYRPRIARELFRLGVRGGYPTFPGLVVKGRVRLAEAVSREVSLGQAEIVLDRFVIARTDEKGNFLIEGLPKLDLPVTLRVRAKDPKFAMAKEVTVDLPGGEFVEVVADLPVNLTPTVLSGRVVDERGAALPGAEVWTDPYTMEALSDEGGAFRIVRRKELDAVGAASERDEPLFGGEYAVYAHRKGYSVERVVVSAESYQENEIAPVRLARQDPRAEEVPGLDIDLKSYLERPTGDLSAPEGGGPKVNP